MVGTPIGSTSAGLNIRSSYWLCFSMVEHKQLLLAPLQQKLNISSSYWLRFSRVEHQELVLVLFTRLLALSLFLFSFGKALLASVGHMASVAVWSMHLSGSTSLYWLGFRASIKIIITISICIPILSHMYTFLRVMFKCLQSSASQSRLAPVPP